MKKVININFQGRVVPIEETAYEILKQYIESLRSFFANEEGRDEIINDIEGRIAELFSDTLKKGSTCITDDDVNTIINSMGRPEDFDDDETKVKTQLGNESRNQQQQTGGSQQTESAPRGRLFRDDKDKLLGGVCGGLANYLRMDPSIIRILFAIITIGGFGAGFLIYILLWIILPSRSLETQIRKRLFRNPDDKVIGGVASGIASYLNIAVWIPRLIFAFPLVIGIITSVFQNAFFHFNPFPSIIFSSFGSTFFIVYIVLWAVIPLANTATEKLEMRGEKIDLNTIKNTIQEDLESFKNRAEKWGSDIKEKSQKFGEEFKDRGKTFASEAAPVARRTGSRIGNAIGIIFKGFFLLIAGIIAFALLMVIIFVMIGGFDYFPLKNFFLEGFWQNFLAWTTLSLFLAVPIIALITWLIRRLIGVKSRNAYLGYIFGGLWFIGLVTLIMLIASIASSYRAGVGIPQKVSIVQPSNNKLFIKADHKFSVNYYGRDWYGVQIDDMPFFGVTEDSFMMRNVDVRIVASEDSLYHLTTIKYSRGNNPEEAKQSATHITFTLAQADSSITLPQGFTLTKSDRFRAQRVRLIIEVPLNKKIELDRSLKEYREFNINFDNDYQDNWQSNWDDNWHNYFNWNTNEEYIMTTKGLKPTHPRPDEINNDNDDNNDDKKQQLEYIQKQKQDLEKQEQDLKKSMKQDSTKYHYKPDNTSDSVKTTVIMKEPEVKIQAETTTVRSATSPSSLIQKFTL